MPFRRTNHCIDLLMLYNNQQNKTHEIEAKTPYLSIIPLKLRGIKALVSWAVM